ncbi:Protein kinase domain containing protein [Reticulomyxa filosa]|uniref:Protein kinase domain containing protein n=1 Tax=Reticulomyxa filosa TaxID=46433 RepID=X6P0I2_RETFI|nr:Protein kinase domain containing protein [Reticulomyxa filosa]|eukprot:ETO31037.1 Protein kinase domain containing protein [Reticulomyxa filosa]
MLQFGDEFLNSKKMLFLVLLQIAKVVCTWYVVVAPKKSNWCLNKQADNSKQFFYSPIYSFGANMVSQQLENKYPVVSEHYDIGQPIGEGTFGKVCKGVHKLSGVEVAVKVLVKKKIVDTSDVERVAREIAILKKLRHINVIRLFEVIDTQRYIFLIMEYASGGELFDYIVSKTRLKEAEACRMFHMIVNGVQYCHQHNVIHRDLKPENLLLDRHKTIKIVDFGLGNIVSNSNDRMLKTACGSPCYAAPEMIAGKLYHGEKADIWSMGVILYALLCGYLPFEDANTNVLYRKILEGKFKVPKWVSPLAHNLLTRILNTNPKDRYSIEDIRKHPWYCKESVLSDPLPGQVSKSNTQENEATNFVNKPLNNQVLNQMQLLGYDISQVNEAIKEQRHNHSYATYHLLHARISLQIKAGTIDTLLAKTASKQKMSMQNLTDNSLTLTTPNTTLALTQSIDIGVGKESQSQNQSQRQGEHKSTPLFLHVAFLTYMYTYISVRICALIFETKKQEGTDTNANIKESRKNEKGNSNVQLQTLHTGTSHPIQNVSRQSWEISSQKTSTDRHTSNDLKWLIQATSLSKNISPCSKNNTEKTGTKHEVCMPLTSRKYVDCNTCNSKKSNCFVQKKKQALFN